MPASLLFLIIVLSSLFNCSNYTEAFKMSGFANTASKSDVEVNPSKNILVTGGVGYIGTHTILCLLDAGYDVTVVDNLVNSNIESIARVRQISGCEPSRIRFFNCDICDEAGLEEVFKQSPRFKSCIHFAGLKAVGESGKTPPPMGRLGDRWAKQPDIRS